MKPIILSLILSYQNAVAASDIICLNSFEAPNIKALWIENSFITLESNNYPQIKAISWWHENFDSSLLRIDSTWQSLNVDCHGVNSTAFVTTANIVLI